MRLLLDSHVLLWLMLDGSKVGPVTSKAIFGSGNEVLISAATVWELEIKRAKGGLQSPKDLLDRTERAGFRLLDITPENALDAARLPLHHNDPFDRMLVAQAQAEAAVLVTHDDTLRAYDVPVMRARA